MSEILLGKKKLIIPIPDWFGLLVGKVIGMMTGDVGITKPEIDGLKANLLNGYPLQSSLTFKAREKEFLTKAQSSQRA